MKFQEHKSRFKKSVTTRISKVIGYIFLTIGFVFSFLDQHRTEEQFGAGTIALGYSKENMQWLPVHYGMIALVCFLIAVIFYLSDHHKESNR